jgi:hypothetical protein
MLGSCPLGSYLQRYSTGHCPSTTSVYVSFAPLYRHTCCPFLAVFLLYLRHVIYLGSSLMPSLFSCSQVQSLNFLRKQVKHCLMLSDCARTIVSLSTAHKYSNVYCPPSFLTHLPPTSVEPHKTVYKPTQNTSTNNQNHCQSDIHYNLFSELLFIIHFLLSSLTDLPFHRK